MRHSAVSRYSSMAFCSATRASAIRRCRSRSYTHSAPVPTQPPLTRLAAPSASSTLSSISRRVRDRSTRGSIAAVDSGWSDSSARVCRTSGSGGKASDAKYLQMSRSSWPGSSTTSARSTARPARPICW